MAPSPPLDLVRRPGVGRQMMLVLIAGFGLLIAAGVTSALISSRARQLSDLVEHTMQVREANNHIMRLVLEAETGQRGYVLTTEAAYLARYRAAAGELEPTMDRLEGLAADNGDQVARIQGLRRVVARRLGTLESAVALAAEGRTAEAIEFIQSGPGSSETSELRATSAEIDREERNLLARRETGLEWAGNLNVIINLVSLAVIGLLAIASIFIVTRYVRGLKSTQEELDRMNRGLEAAVADRTAELRHANDEIQRFAYIVSHDLRAPLVNVVGYTSELETASTALSRQIEAVRKSRPSLLDAEADLAIREDVPEALGFIRASTAKMDRLIAAILKLSRDGRRVLSVSRIDMAATVQAIADSLNHQVEAQDAEIVVGELPPLDSDQLSIDQIFGNLLDNAVKFLDRKRPGRIEVRGRIDGAHTVYEVIDNGRGVAAKDYERVFDLFRRAGAQDRPGEGMGLAFVRGSVRRLGGTITLESEPGAGSTFTLRFPTVPSYVIESSPA